VIRIGDFTFRPRLLPSLLFLLLFPLLIGLGAWQLDRAEQKRVLLERQQAQADTAPLDLGAVAAPGPEARFRAARVRGHYVAGRQWLLDNRIFQGRPGMHVYTLFEIADPGVPRAILVNRGWAPWGRSRQFLPDLPVPAGELELRGRLDRPASVGIALAQPNLASIADRVLLTSLDIPELGRAIGRELPSLALVLDPGQPGVLQRDWAPAIGMSPERHIGYAVQWFALATALLIIFVGVNTRRRGGGQTVEHHGG